MDDTKPGPTEGDVRRWGALVVGMVLAAVLGGLGAAAAKDPRTILIHIKSSLKDDAQTFVAYNQNWAALAEGLDVRVLVAANAVHTYKKGGDTGWEDLEEYRLPGSLRKVLAQDFGVHVADIPRTYGDYLRMLRDKGAKFYVNSEMLVTAKIESALGKTENLGPRFFTPVGPREMFRLWREAHLYMVY